jgi:hypothetical protein
MEKTMILDEPMDNRELPGLMLLDAGEYTGGADVPPFPILLFDDEDEDDDVDEEESFDDMEDDFDDDFDDEDFDDEDEDYEEEDEEYDYEEDVDYDDFDE